MQVFNAALFMIFSLLPNELQIAKGCAWPELGNATELSLVGVNNQ